MGVILNIETSGAKCSVSLAEHGEVVFYLEDNEQLNHAVSLAPFIEKCLQEAARKELKIDAVSVSLGPGSYTGLRIGLSLAKGLSYCLEVPLIGISTLQLLATQAMFAYPSFQGSEILVPMIDARRMEVYTSVFNCSLEAVVDEHAEILNEKSFSDFNKEEKLIFIGDGVSKFKDIYPSKNAVWLSEIRPNAQGMAPLSEKKFREKDFIDIAYSIPNYIKEYQTTVPKNKI